MKEILIHFFTVIHSEKKALTFSFILLIKIHSEKFSMIVKENYREIVLCNLKKGNHTKMNYATKIKSKIWPWSKHLAATCFPPLCNYAKPQIARAWSKNVTLNIFVWIDPHKLKMTLKAEKLLNLYPTGKSRVRAVEVVRWHIGKGKSTLTWLD